jgi:RNA polymerase sigma factor (sigma-70 family)
MSQQANQFSASDSDARLIEGCVVEHRMAQKYLYERYFGRLISVAYRYGKDKQDALDILNQGFLKIFQSLYRYQTTGSLLSWMRTIVLRTALNHIRSKENFVDIENLLETEGDAPLSYEDFTGFDVEYIIKALQQLPVATRTVFSLYAIDGYKHQEIAEMLTISVGTSKWHLSEAKTKLQKILKMSNQIEFLNIDNQ